MATGSMLTTPDDPAAWVSDATLGRRDGDL